MSMTITIAISITIPITITNSTTISMIINITITITIVNTITIHQSLWKPWAPGRQSLDQALQTKLAPPCSGMKARICRHRSLSDLPGLLGFQDTWTKPGQGLGLGVGGRVGWAFGTKPSRLHGLRALVSPVLGTTTQTTILMSSMNTTKNQEKNSGPQPPASLAAGCCCCCRSPTVAASPCQAMDETEVLGCVEGLFDAGRKRASLVVQLNPIPEYVVDAVGSWFLRSTTRSSK